MSDMINVTICDGKYTIIQDATGRTKVLRYGQEWRQVTGDNVILGSAHEISNLRNSVARLIREVEVLRLYGNKDCIAQADEVLAKETKP